MLSARGLPTTTKVAFEHWSGMLRRLLQGKAESTLGEFIRYSVFGSLAFVVDFGLLVILTEFAGLNYLTAAAIAFVAGLAAIYILSISVVFRWRTYPDRFREATFFALFGIVGLGLNQLLMYLLTDQAAIHYTLSKVITATVVLAWNFGSRRLLLFRRGDRPDAT